MASLPCSQELVSSYLYFYMILFSGMHLSKILRLKYYICTAIILFHNSVVVFEQMLKIFTFFHFNAFTSCWLSSFVFLNDFDVVK